VTSSAVVGSIATASTAKLQVASFKPRYRKSSAIEGF